MNSIAIVGSRAYPIESLVRAYVRRLPAGCVVVSGGAPGVDSWAVDEAQACGLVFRVIRPDWERYGRGAGFRRNQEIVDAARWVVAFWTGSNGTADTIKRAARAGKLHRIFGSDGQRIDPETIDGYSPF